MEYQDSPQFLGATYYMTLEYIPSDVPDLGLLGIGLSIVFRSYLLLDP